MPVFAAIGAWAATAIGLTAGTLAFAVVSGVVATGAALLTSRLINGSAGAPSVGGAAARDPGVRVQLSASTENKIPVLYGEAFCSGIMVDAYLDDSDGKKNNVMTYVMVISETCNIAGATYTVEDIFWNDNRLIFADAADASRVTKGVKYVNQKPNQGVAEDFEDDKYDGQVFINLYAGNSNNRIFGSKNTAQAAVNTFGTHWDSTYQYQGLVFAVIQQKYNSEKGFTGLPTLTFRIRNSITNPAAVLADYMTSDRFGANIELTDINQPALAEFEAFCNELTPYTDIAGVSTTEKRYEINGLINTNRSCKENIDTILLNSGAWLSYDVTDGKWRVIPKRALPGTVWSGPDETGNPTDPAPQLIFSDDNITSGIQISSTRLDNLFNIAETEYYDKFNQDQRGFKQILLPAKDRNPAEPDNALSLTLDLTNSNVQAERLANIELKQSRDDLVINFTTSHFGLQAQAGDVIAVYNTLYGWSEPEYPLGKYFRILNTTEKEGTTGALQSDFTAIEYNSDVYSNEPITEFTTSSNIGIIPRDSNPNISAPQVELVGSNSTSGTPSFTIRVTIPPTGGPYDKLEVWYAEGDDWAGTGGDVLFRGQIAGTTLDVIKISNAGEVRALSDTPGINTSVTGTNVAAGTEVLSFGATLAQTFGNGKTGQYTVAPSQANTAIQLMTGSVRSAEITGTVSGSVLTVSSINGVIAPESLIRLRSTFTNPPLTLQQLQALPLATDTVINSQISGTAGGAGTYRLSKPSVINTDTDFVVSFSYPQLQSYERLTTLVPQAGIGGLYETLDIRDVVITNLPPNNTNKRYYIKCRLAIGEEFGEFSALSEVDLEAPVVYWEPDSQSALNIKTELVKMDFGLFTIPRNGLWLMRTAMQLDGGRLGNNNQFFNLDLGNFDTEEEITSADDIEDFTYD